MKRRVLGFAVQAHLFEDRFGCSMESGGAFRLAGKDCKLSRQVEKRNAESLQADDRNRLAHQSVGAAPQSAEV